MERPEIISLALRFSLAVIGPTLAVATTPSSTSTSHQFLVFGADAAGRGALCDLAEQTKSTLLHLLGQRDNWKTRLLINLEYPRANFPDAPKAQLELSQLGFGLKLQLNLLATAELQECNIQREILRGILVEWIYRDRANIAAGARFVSPPDWLLDGLLELEIENGTSENAQLLESVVEANRITPLEEVIRQPRS